MLSTGNYRHDATVECLANEGENDVAQQRIAWRKVYFTDRRATPKRLDREVVRRYALVIRPIDRQDADLELEFLNHLSPEMRHLRFLGLVREPCPEVARELTDLDPSVAAGFIAVVSDEGREREIGAAHFHADPTGKRCDCSVTVSDQWQKRGVGSLLMHQLIEAARTRGMRHMRAFAPAQSGGSRQLAGRLGFQRRLDPHDPGAVVYDLELE